MEYWFTADPHFDHERIITLARRPFLNARDMNRTIIDNYNRFVKPDDYLYILGDFGWGDAASLRKNRAAIKCKNIVFIWGNHDKVLRSDAKLTKELFYSVHDLLDISIDGQAIVLSHYPILEWNKFFHGSWNLFGHVHGNLDPFPGTMSLDVGVDCHDYKPVAFPQLCDIMRQRQSFTKSDVDRWVESRIKWLQRQQS